MKSALLFTLILASSQTLRADAAQPQPLPRPWFSYHHASTALEGALRGYADYISAHGEFFVNRAYAEYVAQRARRLAIQVEQERIRARWQIKDEYKSRAYDNRVAAETIATVNTARLPKRLPPHLLGSATTIHWPAALRGEAFDSERKAMEKALTLRANGEYGAGSLARTNAVDARDRMLVTLHGRIDDLPPMQYMAAKRFVESLAYETLLAPGEQVANK